jgi:hypothetical protein
LDTFHEQQSDGKSFVENSAKQQSGQTDVKVTIFFDVYETNITGCVVDRVAWALNITKVLIQRFGEALSSHRAFLHQVEQGSASVSTGDIKQNTTSVPTNDYFQALTAFPFTVTQSLSDGSFADFIVPEHESKVVSDLKRSLLRDLNPQIDVAPSAAKKVRLQNVNT